MMTNMTLTEFLLARIADTIAMAREVQAQGVTDGLSVDDPRSAALRLARQTITECEAKRRLLDLAIEMSTAPDSDDDPIVAYSDRLIAALALPYGDHPDYREEWRP